MQIEFLQPIRKNIDIAMEKLVVDYKRCHFILKDIPYFEDFFGSGGDHPEHLGLHHVLTTVSYGCLNLNLNVRLSKSGFFV